MSQERETIEQAGARCTLFVPAPDWHGKTAAIGAVDCPDAASGTAVVGAAITRARALGCQSVIGPMDGDTWHSYRLPVWSDGRAPYLLEPSAPPHHRTAFEAAGFAQIAEYGSAVGGTPDAPRPRSLSGLSVRSWRADEAEAELRMIHEISMEAFRRNRFFRPLDFEGFRALYAPILPRIDPELVLFAEGPERAEGFLFGYPDPMDQRDPPQLVFKTYAGRRRGAGRGALRPFPGHCACAARAGDHLLDLCHCRSGRFDRRQSRRPDLPALCPVRAQDRRVTILAPFDAQAGRVPDRTAIVAPDGSSVTYAALDLHARRLAGRLRRGGLAPGDRILVAWPVSPELYAALIAIWRIGAVAVFPEPSAGLSGLRGAIRDARPRACIAPRWLRAICALSGLWRGFSAQPGKAAPVESTAPAADGDPALISFTSGSTGRRKAMIRDHGCLLAQLAGLTPLLGEGDGRRDLVWFPAFVLAELALGQTSILPDADLRRPDRAEPARLAAQIGRAQVERVIAPPSVCLRLSAYPAEESLRHVITGGGPVFPDQLAGLERWAGPRRLSIVYGSTEAEPIAHIDAAEISPSDRAAMADGAGLLVGATTPETALRIAGDEIQVAGPHVVRGYLDPAADAETKLSEGGRLWHRTGDAGRQDAEGRLWLLGRHGQSVSGLYPFEVEAPFRLLPGIEAVALASVEGRGVLAVQGRLDRPVPAPIAARLAEHAIEIKPVQEIPMDRRHRSKIDYGALARLLR